MNENPYHAVVDCPDDRAAKSWPGFGAGIGLCVATGGAGTVLHHVVFWSLIDQGPLHVTIRDRTALSACLLVFGVLFGCAALLIPFHRTAGVAAWLLVAAGYTGTLPLSAVAATRGLFGLLDLQLLAQLAAAAILYRILRPRITRGTAHRTESVE